jgi:hypothetical protein
MSVPGDWISVLIVQIVGTGISSIRHRSERETDGEAAPVHRIGNLTAHQLAKLGRATTLGEQS